MRKAALILVALVLSGCVSAPPHWPPRWQIGTPQAEGAPVYLQHFAKQAEDGNSYHIQFFAITNTANVDPSSPYAADIATNRWPVKRTHVDLSLDGGATFTRRIGYGITADDGRIGGEFVWSPPLDYSLLSTNAVLRATNLDGNPFPSRDPAKPYDVPAGQYPTSPPFVIAGIQCLAPTGGIVWASTPCTVKWRQAGGGQVVKLHWITPTTTAGYSTQIVATLSNCVELATNSASVTMPPPQGTSKLLFISSSDPALNGYSQDISIE